MCELLVGLPDVNVLAVNDAPGLPLEVRIETRGPRPSCPDCGCDAIVKDRREVRLVDLPSFGRPTRLCWRKYRWRCPNAQCLTGSWTEHAPTISWPRLAMTDRAGRWVTEQIGRSGRTVNEIAVELGTDWHTINDTVAAFGKPLIDDPDRIGAVTAIGLDETLFFKLGRWKIQKWATSIVDVGHHYLLDMVEGRNATAPCEWFDERAEKWCDRIEYAALDLSGPYRSVFDTMLPNATQVADPFHVCKLANQKLDEVRRRVQNETMGHRGHKDDPLYRCRRLLTRADERLDDKGRTKLLGLLEAGDPHGEVRTAWHAKELVRQLYCHTDPDTGLAWVTQLGHDLQDADCPPEINQLGRTLIRWRHQIAAWHHAHISNGPTENQNGLIKRIKRVGFGFTNFNNYRLRSLLYAGRPNWDLLATITPQPR
jgi:transposase